jgi:energy-coupling factor transporter ATP-binding protein EcfA2
MGYPEDRAPNVTSRPWNELGSLNQSSEEHHFIEISLEKDITTIVGGNESGKSHLLSAISKVLTGKGIADGYGADGSPFSRTDLCHYTIQKNVNAVDWPNIGLVFDCTSDEINKIAQIAKTPCNSDTTRFTVILAPETNENSKYAHLFFGNTTTVIIDEKKLNEIRKLLPKLEFIHSNLAMEDQFYINALINAYNEKDISTETIYGFEAGNEAIKFLNTIKSDRQNISLEANQIKQLQELHKKFEKEKINSKKSELEVKLFRDVLGVSIETLELLAKLRINERTYADSLINRWNQEIEQKLNLSHYWRQDDSFKLQINYKQGVLFFEITDRTGATYTFRERSSGLRYFLSYYIQAKAIENTANDKSAIILMDEPDSFLSIMGQKNLLSIFESLIHPELSNQYCQLVYTTHSPFLINRNFPSRLRLVRKGDVEEGTQVIDRAMLRRYEPIRSALGIDCAQTLFMGATNVIVEGASDQYLLCELIRYFVSHDSISDFLDLNSIVVLSADSASGVEKLLVASQFGDELIPATVVLLDSDDAGKEAKKQIIGQARNAKKLLNKEFVICINELFDNDKNIVTTEDIIPKDFFLKAVHKHFTKWLPDEFNDQSNDWKNLSAKTENEKNGIVEKINDFIQKISKGNKKCYDKFGVIQDVIELLHKEDVSNDNIKKTLRDNVSNICQQIRKSISQSQQIARTQSGKQTISRLCKDFFIQHKNSSSIYELILFIERIQQEIPLLGVDGEVLANSVKIIYQQLHKLRSASQNSLTAEQWETWKSEIERIKKNPIDFKTHITSNGELKPITKE